MEVSSLPISPEVWAVIRPATALVFGLEILKKLGYEKEAEEIREGMLINFFLEKEGK